LKPWACWCGQQFIERLFQTPFVELHHGGGLSDQSSPSFLRLVPASKRAPRYLEYVGTEFFAVHEAIGRELETLVKGQGSGRVVKDDRLETTFKALEVRLQEVLVTRIARNYSLDDVLGLANRHAALWVIHSTLAIAVSCSSLR
jgi:hypothetical protein